LALLLSLFEFESWLTVGSAFGSIVGSTVGSTAGSTVGSTVGSAVGSAVYLTVWSASGWLLGLGLAGTFYSERWFLAVVLGQVLMLVLGLSCLVCFWA